MSHALSENVDHILYWIPCKNKDEANYLLAIINSGALREAVTPLMTKGLFGPRDLHKHLWRLPIPEFDANEKLHQEIAKAGAAAAVAAQERLEGLQEHQGDKLTVREARSSLRTWLSWSDEGRAVESAVGELLVGG